MLEGESREAIPQPHWARNMESRLKQYIDDKIEAALTEMGTDIQTTSELETSIFVSVSEGATQTILNAIQAANQPTPNNPGPATGIRASVRSK